MDDIVMINIKKEIRGIYIYLRAVLKSRFKKHSSGCDWKTAFFLARCSYSVVVKRPYIQWEK